ncbi:MAG TPA: LLM class flavin-dependent oxidoreductase [Gemmatimonadales bacterium]|nr:LLM class flavin-dependent oxidoreductase [Gemmatimonadales bacterium]
MDARGRLPLGVSVGDGGTADFKALRRLAALAEDLGYQSFWVGETRRWDPFVLTSALARDTREIRFGIGVANMYARSAPALAMAAASAWEVSGGRLIVGVGIGTATRAIRWHERNHDRPHRRLAETVAFLRSAWRGDVARPQDVLRVDGFSCGLRPSGYIPLFVAAEGIQGLRAAARFSDGWLSAFLALDEFEAAVRWIRDSRASTSQPEPFQIVPIVHTNVTEDVSGALEEVGKVLGSRDARVRRPGTQRAISERCAVGSAEDVSGRIRALFRLGATSVVAGALGHEEHWQIERTWKCLSRAS